MRSQPLTDKTRPGGRPRDSRPPANAFAAWLRTCGLTPAEVARRLKVSKSSVYNARNAYFSPGLKLAVRIERLSKGAVSVASWASAKTRPRKQAA